jgi:hypothetical protein
MPDPAREHHSAQDPILCHAYPLACSGVSAARSALRRSSFPSGEGKGVRRAHAIPACTHACCYLFEEIHPDPQGSEL